MDKYEISAKIGFGQNFLMDDKAIEKMEEAIFHLIIQLLLKLDVVRIINIWSCE